MTPSTHSAPSTNSRLVAFGELLLRLDTPGHQRITQTGSFTARYTGGEANVAVALAQLGWPAAMVSKVPAHEIGSACINSLRQYGVDTAAVARGGDRLGILYVENGASQRPTSVIYDRLHTSIRGARPDEFDWPAILSGAGWFHFTGTAPALGENVREVLRSAISQCRLLSIPVSFDCSYRSALWPIEQAALAFQDLAADVDLLIASPSDARNFFRISAADDRQAIAELHQIFNVRQIAYTEREIHSASVNLLSGILYDGTRFFDSRRHRIEIIDRIGSGDAFAAGVIFGLLSSWPQQQTIEFATAAAVLKHSLPGDFNLVSREEIERLVADDNFRIRR